MYAYPRTVTQEEVQAYIDGIPAVVVARWVRDLVRSFRRSYRGHWSVRPLTTRQA